MKKTLIVVALGMCSFSASANWYAQGDLGFSSIYVDNTGVADFNKTVFDQRISIGYNFNNIRVAADYTNFGKVNTSDDDFSAEIKIKSFGISTLYDFKNNSKFIPYIGARLGYSTSKLTGHDRYTRIDNNGSSFSYGILGGLQYKLSSNLYLNTGLEVNRLASDAYQFGGKVGLRYNF